MSANQNQNQNPSPNQNPSQSADAPKAPEQKTKSNETVYWSKAEKLKIANFSPEERAGERLIKPEGSLGFNLHIRVCRDRKEIEFIENSDAFKNGDIVKVKDVAEANRLTAQLNAMRGVKDVTTQSIESTVITEDGQIVKESKEDAVR